MDDIRNACNMFKCDSLKSEWGREKYVLSYKHLTNKHIITSMQNVCFKP